MAALSSACAPSLEGQLWQVTRAADTVPAYAAFLDSYPDGARAARARRRLDELTRALVAVRQVRLDLAVRYVTGGGALEIDGVDVPMAADIAAVLGCVPLALITVGGPDRGEPDAAVTGPDGTTAVLQLQLEGRALHQGYAPADERRPFGRTVTRQYAGARMTGSIALTTAIGTVYARDFVGQAEPPSRIGGALYPSPRDAPFEAAFEQVVLPEAARLVAALYGTTPLLRALEAEALEVRTAAASGLGDRADTAAVGPLLELLKGSASFRLQATCARALGLIGDRRATGPLIEALRRAFDMELRATAAEALGRLSDPCAVAPLLGALDDAPPVREAARRALRRLTGETKPAAWRAWRHGETARPCGYDDGD